MNKTEENKKGIIPNTENLSLKDYFAGLPKAEHRPVIISAPKEELVTEIARLCGKTKMTARRWAYGHTSPCPAEMNVIAGLIGSPVEVLFPEQHPRPPTKRQANRPEIQRIHPGLLLKKKRPFPEHIHTPSRTVFKTPGGSGSFVREFFT